MQTFITAYPGFNWGVSDLDQKRLVKQLLECRQIMAALAGETKGWVNHPATKMWRGKEDLLWNYSLSIAKEMGDRGYNWKRNLDELSKSYIKIMNQRQGDTIDTFSNTALDKIIYTHRGRLFEKDPEYYAQWSAYTDYKKYVCCDRCNYYWPTHLEK